jgi:hypothetical protein
VLGIHCHHFARGQAEKGWIELIDSIHKAAVADMCFAGRVDIRVIIVVQLPAAGWGFGDGVNAVAQILPKLCRCVHR